MSESWRLLANCRGVNPEVFFPQKSTGNARAAKAVCAGCEVTAECLAAGMKEKLGVWGGTTERERRKMARERRLVRTRTNTDDYAGTLPVKHENPGWERPRGEAGKFAS